MTKKFADSNTSPKTYWTILNRLLHNKNSQQYHFPLLVVSCFKTFVKKQTFLITFFASINTLIDNASCLSSFLYRTGRKIKSFHVIEHDILAAIKTLDPNKAHGCDNISIKMIKTCSQSLILPLKTIFENSLKKGKFPETWKKANVVKR